MKIVHQNLTKQLFLALCALFVVASLEAACMGGKCNKKPPRVHNERGCRSCSNK
ncbi:MAG: hypothetical protein K2X90_03680 [Candidatus Babeliaceae bacterium]|nr:hypothetical protein [Candidatus Babeliaceae bacterium]